MIDITKFLSCSHTSLKVCGITSAEDAQQCVILEIPAIGINFWPSSKRYTSPEDAHQFLQPLAGKIIRVGVFVNADPAIPLELLKNNAIDIAQFHGDETPDYTTPFKNKNVPFIKAIGVKNADSLKNITAYQADAILLDAHAPGVYGGTGDAFDWNLAKKFITEHPKLPVILAGGITPENAEQATREVHPAALDVASGSESSPGIKDFTKIKKLSQAIQSTH